MPKNKHGSPRNSGWQSRNNQKFKADEKRSPQPQSNSNDELDIPGFYYDKEKKRYFKIAPNHSANSFTKDAIHKKEAETQRKKDIHQIFQKKNKPYQTVGSCILNKINICNMILARNVAFPNSSWLKINHCRRTVCNLKPAGSQCLIEPPVYGMYDHLEHIQKMHIGKNHDEILGLWSLKETYVQRIQIVNLSEGQRALQQKSINVTPSMHEKVIIQSLNKVTDICWAPMNNDTQHILYTTVCHTGSLYSLAMIRSLVTDDTQQTTAPIDFNLGRKATWTCAWNRHKNQFSVGSEKLALVLNVDRRTMWEYSTNHSDPLSLTFSNQTGTSLHMGTRKGQLLTFDLRSRSTFPVSTLHHKSSVCGLNLLQNDVSLLATDFSGKVCLWDMRKRSTDPVVVYHGNINQYTKLPVHVDEMEKIIYTVGEDGYTRFWCLQQGTLLHTIPPPCAVTRETIPCVQLSMRWGDRQGNAGLIMGLENKLHYYGTVPLD